MNYRNLLLLTGAVVAICVVNATAKTQTTTFQTPTQEVQSEPLRWEYAELQMQGDHVNDEEDVVVKWLEGDKRITPDPVKIGVLINKLSRRSSRPTTANLLNAVGANGWELVTVIEHSPSLRSWTFIRKL